MRHASVRVIMAALLLASGCANAKDSLYAGERLTSNQYLQSSNGNYRFILQSDGNVVLYNASNRPLWASNTVGKGGVTLNLQGDGNLVLRNTGGSSVWSTGTHGKGANRAVMQNDANVVLLTSSNAQVWATGTRDTNTDVTRPLITLAGSASMTLSQGSTFTDPGATATDNVDGNITSRIVRTGSVNTSTPGTYTLRYDVRDTAGNNATTVTRMVTVTSTSGGGGGGDGVKIAFIGDTGYGSNFQSVLNLIKAEKAQLTVVAGDTSYSASGDDDWDSRVRNTLGSADPALVVAGNHDYEDSNFGSVKSFGQSRLNRQSNVSCSGSYGEQNTCRLKNVYLVMSSIGSGGSRSSHESFISSSLDKAPAGAWRICAWHKNQRDMQVGDKTDEVGWTAYETCREKGAIIATGHEHSYERTHLLSDMSDKTISSTSSTFTVSPGRTFAFVSGLGGIGLRDQERSGNWWAKIYTSTQGATYGAMFGTFYADRAEFYFKNIKGQIIDQFTVRKGY